MPTFTLLLGRKTIQIYDLDQPSIQVGRDPSADIVIDNPSVSRRHAEIRKEGGEWVLEDLGSSNGTFLHGDRIESPTPMESGDEIGFGKFSLVFDRAVGEGQARPSQSKSALAGAEGTMHIEGHEVSELLKSSERERRAHLEWESGGRRGKHYLSEDPAVLFGKSDLCDVKVPKAPKQHVLVLKKGEDWEIRNLHWWSKMRIRGEVRKRARLKDGDVVEVGGLKLTFVDAIT